MAVDGTRPERCRARRRTSEVRERWREAHVNTTARRDSGAAPGGGLRSMRPFSRAGDPRACVGCQPGSGLLATGFPRVVRLC
ncbi:protein of unknown function [Burkholderia multivorans]